MTRVRLKGVNDLVAKLRDPRLIMGPLKELLSDAAALGQKIAEQGVDGGLGLAVRTMGRHVDPTSAKVYTMLPRARAQSIEKGRRPSEVRRRDLLPQIIRWREAVGHPDPAIEIINEMKRTGVKGKRFMEQARQAVAEDLPRLTERMGRQVEEMARR